MYRIVMEIDRGAGLTGAARYAFRNAEPSPTIDEEGWFVFDRGQMIGETPIGMPSSGTVRFNPMRVVWWASCATETSPDDRPLVA